MIKLIRQKWPVYERKICTTASKSFIGADLHFVGNNDNKLYFNPFLGIFGSQTQVKCGVLLSQLFK